MTKEGKQKLILVAKEIHKSWVVELTEWAVMQLSSQHSSLAGHWVAPLMEQHMEYLRGIWFILNPFPRVK